MFLSRNKKNNVYPCKPQFYYIKVGFKGVEIVKACFRDDAKLFYAQKKFYSIHLFNKIKYFHFPHSKKGCKLCRNGMVGKLEVDFQRVPLVQIF